MIQLSTTAHPANLTANTRHAKHKAQNANANIKNPREGKSAK
jgi:hypothetical protein